MQRAVDIPGKSAHAERLIGTWNGFVSLGLGIALIGAGIWELFHGITAERPSLAGITGTLLIFFALFATGVLLLAGLYTVQPNEAAILQLFGSYRGSTRVSGLRGTNPFYTRRKISLRARNLNGERLKVNDKQGNPIEIAAVVVWRVADTAKASFDVDNYENYVKLQSEAAVRHLASTFAYDEGDGVAAAAGTHQPTLLASADIVTRALVLELQQRLDKAGVVRRGGAAHAPRLRAGDRAGHAAPAAGRGGHRRAAQDRQPARCPWWRWRSMTFPPSRSSTSTMSARRRWSAT